MLVLQAWRESEDWSSEWARRLVGDFVVLFCVRAVVFEECGLGWGWVYGLYMQVKCFRQSATC
jgi:hypothetical protein